MKQPPQLKPKDTLAWEKELWNKNILKVAGLDEAGRGAWAGPVVAAAVILKPHSSIPGIDDSKKLTPKRRDVLFDQIKDQALAYGIGIVDSATIDQVNIFQASLQAMVLAVRQMSSSPEFLLIDGQHGIQVNIPQKALVKGDSLSASIGAASILAKVTRDRLMCQLDEMHPIYQFAKHKGYGTQVHRKLLESHGMLDIHRKSFEPMKSMS